MAAGADEFSEFYRARSIREASELLQEHEAVLVAGGQSLMPLIRQGLIQRDAIVDISGIESHDTIDIDDQLSVGGLATHRDLIEADLEATPWRALGETAAHIGDRQVRNWGTIGGSVAHADPSLDYPPSMAVLEAVVEYWDGRSTETVPITDFYLGEYVTVLEDHHIVTGVRVPRPPERTGVAFEKFGWRKGDMALVNAAARLTADGSEITDAKLCVGAVAPVPLRLEELESELVGADLTDTDSFEAIAAKVSDFTKPVAEANASVEYKNRLTANLLLKALERAAERVQETRQ